jgi:sugar lactone lactonase YvrE
LWADLGPAGLRNPDGICLDATGRIWVANAGSPVCSLVEEGGTVVDEVVASQPCFACALGGPDGRSLFLVTAPRFGDDLDGTNDGRIEVAIVDVPAAGV